MAGLSLYFEDGHDDLDDFGFDDYGTECDGIRITAFLDAGQDNLTPLGRLEKYAFSENEFNRQIVARGLLDVLREFSDNENDFLTVMETVARMSEDGEPTVRAELMEQVPNIAMFLHERRPNFPVAFSRYLIPIVVRYLTDPNNQVRKTSQAALLVLLEQGLISKNDVESKVCPVLLDLTTPSSDDDYKIEAVAIMCKLVSMLTKDTVEHLLLHRFCDLCSDGRLFQVRKVCAANFGDFCSIVGQDATEKLLIAKFFELCSDSVWGIRKACAECFMTVSNSTSPEVRRTKLSPLFISLISDPSRWVRQAAFQSLGRFISTFVNPTGAGLYFKEDVALRELAKCTPAVRSEIPVEGYTCREQGKNCCESGNCKGAPTAGSEAALVTPSNCTEEQDAQPASPVPCKAEEQCCLPAASENNNNSAEASPIKPEKHGLAAQSSEDTYNSFNYWRPPLPDISQDLELLQAQVKGETESVWSSEGPATHREIQKALESLQPHMDDLDVQAQVQVLSAALKAAQLDVNSEEEMPKASQDSCSTEQQQQEQEQQETPLPASPSDGADPSDSKAPPVSNVGVEDQPPVKKLPLIYDPYDNRMLPQLIESVHKLHMEQDPDLLFEEEKSKIQNVIPQQLLDQYLSMTDPARAQTVDTEIAKHCAFSLPGVALTLGRQNWHCLKDTYETLATDVQWKVRRTLAFSIHELAMILGEQLTAADLVPIFNGFLKDLDEVRIGVLKHLYDFLKLLHADKRREYLFQLQEFMVTDNSRNWRFRYELAEQLILIVELYSHNDVYDYLRQIALTLCSDKVSEVRWISYRLVVEILRKFYRNGANDLGLNFLNELVMRFCHCPKWVGRQAFAFICQAVVEEDCMPVSQFAEHLLPSLIALSADPVANVRVLVAKALRQTVLEKAYFKDAACPHQQTVEETVMALQADRDRDVRFFASLEPSTSTEDTAALI
ncbi:PP4R1 phosphatase, partial [Polyodon spathula]|nr:PP4R1 phosphatase [Polyodon spathula]